jgi:hypothetical protein
MPHSSKSLLAFQPQSCRMPIERQMNFGVVRVIRRRHVAAEGSFGREMNECAQEFSDRGSYA